MAHVTRGQGIGAIVLGILKLILGIVIVIFGFVLASKFSDGRLTAYWGGFIYFVPGILGIVAGATKNNCCMIAYMVINIIYFVLFGIGCIVIFIAVAFYADIIDRLNCISNGSDGCRCYYNNDSYDFKVACSTLSDIKAPMWGIAVSCLFAGLLLLASSILGCISSCCTSPPPQGFMYQEQPPAMGNTVIVSSQQQQGVFQPPPYGYNPPPMTDKSGPV